MLQRAELSSPRIATLGVGFVKFIGAACALWGVDRLGRRACLLAGTVAMIVGHAGLALAFWPETVNGALALCSLLLYILAWNCSWAGLMLTLAAELLPQRVRAAGTGLAYAIYWLCSFAISQTLESTFELVGTATTFALYGGATTLSFVFAWAYVPETCGVMLDQIEEEVSSPRKRG